MTNRRAARRAGAALLGALMAFAGPRWLAAAPDPPVAGEAAVDAALHERGREVYNARCYFCHGYSGDAKTLAAAVLVPPPRDFTRGAALGVDAVAAAVQHGRPGTAMASFAGLLDEAETRAVAAFVVAEFVRDRAANTAYHTPQNGWPGHERYAAAFPFATGAIGLDRPLDTLDAAQQRGRQLYFSACVSCHDRSRSADAGPAWSARPLSYPRFGFAPGQAGTPVDAVSSASPHARHDVAPRIAGLTARQRRGERLFQANCAFCHGADGTGRNWIGQFMEPKARDLHTLTAAQLAPARLRAVILDGLPGTSMPAWRGVLTPAQADAIGAYVGRAFGR